MTDTILRVRGLKKSYGAVHAVRGVDLDVAPAECVSIIGPNGAGKSTLFGTIAGEHRATAGTIEFEGRSVTSWSAARLARHGVSRTFQVARLFTSRTVEDNLAISRAVSEGRGARFWDRLGGAAATQARVADVMDELDLHDIARVPAGVLPQGDRKRLELAMALVQDPQMLLLDEPTAGMSLDDTARTIATLQRIRSDHGNMTVVLTAHDMDVVFALSDRVVLMGQGVVVIEGTPSEVEQAPETRELYLGVVES
ncbi:MULTISPECIES: ABC transporter ATP-binding protein [Microbacterium]|uniref:ABC transporter ATP-binding protein n=1 Tax=Microbacterium wangchenii TaxID=2541726 RepID=A0ABX5T015_9MICO|nr:MULTISPECIES: ABC transporter ATP-binding protein [Microbacterium]MCK6066146.1 ABC transporter ATP-binding protein [Microbacterium sp. EYE_512]QBR90424.1 ABC transporter ATP-binding protein [Microbacterium wangchenii]TXK14449.1 ABC transporter ATP-binding protein [Microbacterium wangchenii]